MSASRPDLRLGGATPSATPAAYARATDLFLAALDRDPAARAEFLDASCVDDAGAPDAALRREVEALLASHREADYLEAPLVSREGADPMLGQTVGPWRLTHRVGEGGMGAVYRAERADGTYERTVALKLLRPGPRSDGLAARLRAERQILAGLEHPHIARLYDGGVTPGGMPYLALEYVEGVPLTEAAAALPLDDRLRLVLQVCDAVAYAHQRLVVHRDLKPSNVLVTTGDGPTASSRASAASSTVKLLDFGIATILDAEADGLMTVTGAQLLTPAYAAPEQVLGQAITTATDVYALGVLLYEVLTGQRPYDLGGQTARGIERAVCETVPPPPSSAASPTAARPLRGDLDTIVMTALAKEPDRRYATARALADDIQRYLDHLPIAARPATVGYRLRSFARRYRTGVAAGAVALLALATGLGTALWQGREAARARDHAQSQFEIAQDAARALIYDVHDAVAGIPGSTEAREVIVSRSLDYLDRLSSDANDDDDALRIDLAEAYFRIGNVLGNPTDGNLGRTTDARVSYRHGLAALPDFGPLTVGDTLGARAESIRGRLYEKLGVVQAHMGQLDSALHHIDLALAAHARALAADPSPARRTLLATSHINRGDYSGHPHFPSGDRPDLAFDHYLEARRLLEAIPSAQRDLFALRMLGITHEREGSLLADAGAVDGALAAMRRSSAIRAAIAERPDATTDAKRDVGVSFEAIGRVLRQQDRLAEARAELAKAHAVYSDLYQADPANSNARETLAFGEIQLARLHGGPEGPNLGDWRRARAHYHRALDLLRPLSDADPANTRMRSIVDETEAHLRAVGG